MALVYIEDGDPWLAEFDSCEKLFREIMEQLTLRNQEPRTSQTYANLSVHIRLRIKQYSSEVQQLKVKVGEDSKLRSINNSTAEEAERRSRQIEQLESKDIQLQQLYNGRGNVAAAQLANLLKPKPSAFADMGTTSWGLDDDDPPLDTQSSIADLKMRQQQLLQEQDEGLETLSKVISRQKEIATTISNEVDHQNEIIDDLADHMERTDERLINGTRQVRVVDKKDRTCGYWVLILILFVAIITVALV